VTVLSGFLEGGKTTSSRVRGVALTEKKYGVLSDENL
jgi:hypothetical protein